MFNKIAYRNLKKSRKIYFVYFLTLTLSIALFYSFNSLYDQPFITSLEKNNQEYVVFFKNIIKYVSMFISLVTIFLIAYASNFFIKMRYQEFFVYKSLGIGKRKLFKILMVENLIIYIVALFSGIIIGTGISIILLEILKNILEISAQDISPLNISIDAVKLSAIYFGIILAIVSIINAFKVTRLKLIDLKRQEERIKIKKPHIILNILILIMGISLLVTGYYTGYKNGFDVTKILFPITLIAGASGTILTYIGYINLRISIKGVNYYQKTNAFEKSILDNTMHKNKISIAINSLSLFIIVTTILASSSLMYIMRGNLQEIKTANPEDAAIYHYVETEAEGKNHQGNKILEKDIAAIENSKNLDVLEFSSYYAEKYQVPIISKSDYLKFAKFYNFNPGELTKPNVYFSVGEIQIFNDESEKMESVSDPQKLFPDIDPNDLEVLQNKGVQNLFPDTGILVKDDNLIINDNNIIKNYSGERIKFKNGHEKEGYQELKNLQTKIRTHNYNINGDFYDVLIYKDEFYSMMFMKAIIILITIYIAITLLIITLATLAIQQIMNSLDNKRNFEKLKLLGVTEKEINKIILKNSYKYFTLPLILASISSVISVIIINKNILQMASSYKIINEGFPGIVLSLLILILIYIIYFVLANNIYKRIINNK